MWRHRSHPGFPRKRHTAAGARLLLLTGTPGTGKRVVGNYLQEQCGFVHLDFENLETRARFLGSGTAALQAEIAAVAEAGKGLVVTWDAASGNQLPYIRRLRSLGLESIWFDSDRGAACQALFTNDARRASRFHFVDSFDPDGGFRPIGAVATELLEPRPQVRPHSARDRAAAVARAVRRPAFVGSGWRIAAGLAFAAAAGGVAGALLPGVHGGARQPARVALAGHAVHARPVAVFPRHGVLVSGRSLAGVRLGDTKAMVRAVWGHQFTKCHGCKPATWFYLYPTGDPVGAGVEFRGGRVVAVFTLGSPAGWHTEAGIKVGALLNPFNDPNDPSEWKSCAGYSAKSTPTTGNAVTSILTQGQSVYGFALTRPSVSPCH